MFCGVYMYVCNSIRVSHQLVTLTKYTVYIKYQYF